MRTRDGVRLDADVYWPDGPGPFPVLLMRQPYGRAIASTVVYAHPRWYAHHGYIVVIQDVRGRGSSEGEFQLFAREVEDGGDSVAWAARLPESDGQVGMYGFSYQGMTQLYAAQAQPPALKALAPAMVGYDLYRDWAYENGALRLQAGLGWALQLAAETARRTGDAAAFTALRAASRNLPLTGPVAADPQVLKQYAPDSFWHDWLAHPKDDGYWRSLQPDLSQVDLPMLHVGGWFDPYLTGNIRLYQELAARTQSQHLWIGPWSHIPWSRRVGDIDFGPAAMNPIDAIQLRWFNQMLKGKDTHLLSEPSVHLFEMGHNGWRTFDRWPQGQPQTYWLQSTGLAALREDDGWLVTDQRLVVNAAKSDKGGVELPHCDIWVHDPWRPVPALGGHAGVPAGAFERSAIDGRSDVVTYTTAPLERDWAVAGEAVVQLQIEADAPSYDLSAVLSAVHQDGQVYPLTQGYGRFERSGIVEIWLQPTCFRLSAGRSLRLSLSAACFPAYAVGAATEATLHQPIITLTLHHGAQSLLTLPTVP